MCILPHTEFSKENKPCDVTFATDGYSYIEFPTEKFCCRCNNKFGSVSYDWLQKDSQYQGIETVSGQKVTHWTKQGIFLNHYYATVDKQLPVRFFEIKQGHPKAWDFFLDTYSTDPINPEKFKPKCTQPCGGKCPFFPPTLI